MDCCVSVDRPSMMPFMYAPLPRGAELGLRFFVPDGLPIHVGVRALNKAITETKTDIPGFWAILSTNWVTSYD